LNKLEIRKYIIQAVYLVAGILIIGKTAQLQILNTQFAEKAKRTTLHKRTLFPSRGIIYDRNEQLLVINEPIYNINAVYNELDPKMDTAKFCNLLRIDKATFIKNITKNFRSNKYSKSIPFTFQKGVSPEDFSAFQEHLHEFPGFYPQLRNVRSYPHSNAANILGYLGEVSEKQITDSVDLYGMGDFIGKSGIEKTYETFLRGNKGIEFILKDNLGREVSSLAGSNMDSLSLLASEGKDIMISLDLKLQQFGEQLMDHKRGSIVAIEPKTGEILAMVSTPNYDPNLMQVGRDRTESVKKLLADTINKPFLDRSVISRYPPGSIFKTVLSLAAMQEKVVHANTTIYCDGEYEINTKGAVQKCHSWPHPQSYNVHTALQFSCNSYYYHTMRNFLEIDGYRNPGAGLDKLNGYLEQFGIGTKLGIDHMHENPGFFPDSKYFDDKYKGIGWRSTYILSLGIGQGEIQLTTAQMANLAAIIANRGHYYTPHLIKNFINSSDPIPLEFTERRVTPVEPQYFEPVIRGMEKVVREGTAQNAYVPGLDICGKTGTSQNPHGKDHSVFFAFAPKDDPKIAIAVYVENAGWGASYAAPIASLMIEKHLNQEISQRRQWLVDYMAEKDLISLP